ncbi:OLC1v1006352C1 [Oldenlandia corymbosa var. corymbosa]|uniref:OLC1v1006352C1 n=1 Tax=Oldenlandia corymbosa var. corymbosa TaxID=529605 RepID=A0AAV1DI68_OLDCO|nr:OLC1v1006352C1 [Oldenlandia corymbosa var. corymbosa]
MENKNGTNWLVSVPGGISHLCHEMHPAHPFGIGVFYGDDPFRYSIPIMLLEISMLIVIIRILRFVLKPLRQPRIVSEILGGIIMGPSVLARSKKFRSYMFPQSSDFVLKNLAVMGFMYFLFISGVRTDMTIATRARKKHWVIALVSVFVPIICTAALAIPLRKSLGKELAKASSILGTSTLFAMSAFPVLQLIIKEFNLLSSEIGRLAMLIAVISDVVGINFVVVFEAAKQEEGKSSAAIWYVISLVAVMALIFGGLHLAMLWIIKTTPVGKQVDQIYVIAILLGVLVVGFVTDMLGIAIANGPLWLGLAVPDGPPLGAILLEKSEMIVMELFMAFAFTYVGLLTDVSSMSAEWAGLQPIFLMAVVGFLTKVIATMLASRFFGISWKESLALGLILNLRGQVELLLFIHWMDFKMITIPYFTMLVLMTTVVTAVATPLFSILYDPTKPYRVNKRRDIQHNPLNSELRIVVSIFDEESVTGIINLLDICNPTRSSPFGIYALELTELIARATPIFIDHEKEGADTQLPMQSPIHRAFMLFQESRSDEVKMYHYTSKTAKRSMYQDICELALIKKASFIILPYHDEQEDHASELEGLLLPKKAQSVQSDVLSHAPCSVGVFVHRGSSSNNFVNDQGMNSAYHFAVIFLGGADSREALTFAERTTRNPFVFLTVVRFLSQGDAGDDRMEKKLDDGVVTSFWVKHEGNNQINYREVVVRNGEETVAAIQSMSNSNIDLWIVGRKHGINPYLLQGLSEWSKHDELGVLGEYLASSNLGGRASILVVQQQLLRG